MNLFFSHDITLMASFKIRNPQFFISKYLKGWRVFICNCGNRWIDAQSAAADLRFLYDPL